MIHERVWNEAVEILEEALQSAPNDPDLLIMMGDCQRALGMDRRAIACYMGSAAARPAAQICPCCAIHCRLAEASSVPMIHR